MRKLLTIIGARPQIIKAAALSRVIRGKFHDSIEEVILHTGQHYDNNMSEVFFGEMQIPKPKYNLRAGSASHGEQTAAMIKGIEEVIKKEKADAIVLYGDTNSTLAGAVAASKIHVPVVHIEAGLRSYNKYMPEEINRIMCDHASTLLFSPTKTGVENLIKEGFQINNKPPYTMDNPGVFHCGDVMYDNTFFFTKLAEEKSNFMKMLDVEPGRYILATIHRNTNTDVPERLSSIMASILKIAEENRVHFVIPLHPRTKKMMPDNLPSDLLKRIKQSRWMKIIPPVSFFEIILLEKNAKMLVTDSGGVQKEAYFFKKPSIILRPQTEWIEIVENGNAILADADEKKIMDAFNDLQSKQLDYPPIFGDGNAADFICRQIVKQL